MITSTRYPVPNLTPIQSIRVVGMGMDLDKRFRQNEWTSSLSEVVMVVRMGMCQIRPQLQLETLEVDRKRKDRIGLDQQTEAE